MDNTTEVTTEDTIDVYVVSSGLLECAVVGEEASRWLCKRMEMLDPWRGIPFVQRRTMSHTEALRTMQEISVKNTLEAVKRESNK
jgi:hypothetical protein